MPGILPMKVIKVGNSAQSRIAQACDRCRSKKIRCDGIRPCCTQCANVGFECKTSDKLSRRAFPRGYTESLEERVRSLEAEVRDLKSLLDEKDEKIDVLSRIHSFTTRRPSMSPAAGSVSMSGSESKSQQQEQQRQPPVKIAEEEVIPVRQTCPPAGPPAETPFPAMSSTHRFADFLAEEILTQNNPSTSLTFKTLTARPAPVARSPTDREIKTPPRLVSDQLINIFFQEWAPLYPVVHRPTILKAYEQYLSDEESLRGNRTVMAQLNLIFGIAALSSTARTNQDPTSFEGNWASRLEFLSSEVSLPALQCFVLAEIYCMTKADYRSLLRYRAIATNMCHRLGLHHSQTRFAHNPLVTETRKKVFWCQYVLDRFTSALTGLPALLRTENIRTEYPMDVDDENVTETGFLPTLPGESTRLSSALALFEVSRILNTALDVLYPSGADYDISVSKMRSVAEELDAWSKNLPQHLRLQFSQDKPSTHVTSSRSPLLSLVYYWIRSLIHRPAACFASQILGSPSSLVLCDCSKHIVQILQLLDERRLCLSVSINRKELVVMSGIGLLRQFVGLNRESKLARESQRLLTTVVDQLERESSSAAAEFRAIANHLTCGDVGNANTTKSTNASQEMPAPPHKSRSPHHQLLQSWKHRLSMSGTSPTRTATTTLTTTTSPPPPPSANTDALSRRNTISGARPAAATASPSPSPLLHPLRSSSSRASLHSHPSENVSYSSADHNGLPVHHRGLSYPNSYDPSRAMSYSAPSEPPAGAASSVSMSEWEYVLGNMDRGSSNIFNGIYGGRMCGDHYDYDGGGDDTVGPFAALTGEYTRKMQQQQQQQQQREEEQHHHRHSITGVEGSFPFSTATASTATTAVAPSSELPDLSPVAWSSSSSGGGGGGNGDISTGTHRLLSFSEESSLGSSVEEPLTSSSSYGHYALLDPYGDDTGGAVRLVPLEDEFEGFGCLLEGWDQQLAV